MARIRTIKPEFPQSETIGRLSRDSRLLFIQLWTIADDSGRARANSRVLAGLLYPYDSDAGHLMEPWLEELEAVGCIRLYTFEGSTYLEICNWLKHQKIDRPSASRCPGFDDGEPIIREGVASPREPASTDLGPRTVDLGPRTKDHCTAAAPPDDDDPQWFAEFRGQYPKRGGDPNWRGALRAAQARIREGHRPEEFVDGARRYAKFLAATGRLGTEFVQQASRFLGPGKPFALPWDPPATPTGAGNGRKSFEQQQAELAAIAGR